eukprot:TRINITY_DN23613_c0_g1_i1.p1 TRINITY_DN23613_c0_g1~~TRINITY_DN23613_c0_g1_i1.p1  ORF type:complete len:1001 (+),score=211.65 TRINITY_DN23613_c0_g1_i1:76-3078(+)
MRRLFPTLLLLAERASGGVVSINVPGTPQISCQGGQIGITETDVRAGGRAILLQLAGDTWKNTDFHLYRPAIIAGLRSASDNEVTGFTAKRATILPLDAVVIDMRRNDYTVLALLFEADETYDILRDEKVSVDIPANATTSGTKPTLADAGGGIPSFMICAAQSVLQAPPVIEEQQLRDGGLELNLFLTMGEQFVQRQTSAIVDLIRNFNSSLYGNADEPENFFVRRNILLDPVRFEPIAPNYEQLRITLSPDPVYNFYSPQEIVNITLPKTLMVSGFEPTPQSSLGFVIRNSAGQAWIDGAERGLEPDITEQQIRDGTASIILVLKHDKWRLQDPRYPQALDTWISTFISQEGQQAVWDGRIAAKKILLPDSFVLLDHAPGSAGPNHQLQRLQIRFQADSAYELVGVAQEAVVFRVPSIVLQSGLPPRGAGGSGSGTALFEFTIKAMGQVEIQPGTQQLLPHDSGDLSGSSGEQKQIEVLLRKDKWKPATCADSIRAGFNSTLSRAVAPYAFLAKLDRIVDPAGVSFSECPVSATACSMIVRLRTEQTYTLAPADESFPPQPETISLTIPPRCVMLNIQPAGVVQFPVYPHPTEVSYRTFSPGATPEAAGSETVYADRAFDVELFYAPDGDWISYQLIKGIDCLEGPDQPAHASTRECRCSADCKCNTMVADVNKYPKGLRLSFAPTEQAAGQVWTDTGSWSVCVMRATTRSYVRIRNPITIEQDPATVEGPKEFDLAGEINAQIVVIGGLFALCMIIGIAWIVREIILASKEDQKQEQKVSALANAVPGGIFGALAAQRSDSRHQSVMPAGGFHAFGEDPASRVALLEEGELPDIDRGVARFAFSEFGEADPNVQRLEELRGMAYHEQLVSQKRRLQDVGMIESEDSAEDDADEEFEENEEEEEAGYAEDDQQGVASPFAARGGYFVTGAGEPQDRRDDLYGSDSDEEEEENGAAAAAPPPAAPGSFRAVRTGNQAAPGGGLSSKPWGTMPQLVVSDK